MLKRRLAQIASSVRRSFDSLKAEFARRRHDRLMRHFEKQMQRDFCNIYGRISLIWNVREGRFRIEDLQKMNARYKDGRNVDLFVKPASRNAFIDYLDKTLCSHALEEPNPHCGIKCKFCDVDLTRKPITGTIEVRQSRQRNHSTVCTTQMCNDCHYCTFETISVPITLSRHDLLEALSGS
mgnify:FL=1